ncbi:MAG: T9SS type A sorting domain-containing protein, partial [Candidatus Marinimicrobia bacterium]|nr:T9SS type A sorting domain-containing protein [Candidatus Neomarinimicrobiota bacterium]
IAATLSTTSNLVTIFIPTVSYGTIVPGESEYGETFSLSLLPSAIDEEDTKLRLNIVDDSSNEWNAIIPIDVQGSLLTIDGYSIEGGGFINPGETKNISISLGNTGSITANNVFAELNIDSELLEILDSTGSWGNISSGETVESTDLFTISASHGIINGTMLPLSLHIQSNDGYNRIEYFNLQVGEITEIDPLGPDNHGYYIYDSGDVGYSFAPVYNWIEIDPSYGGEGTSFNMVDYGYGSPQSQQSAHLNLPFTFRFYRIGYEEITISTNGWIAFGYSELESFRNYPIPGPGGPSPMVAVFWDDLKTSGGGNVYAYIDSAQEYVIIEWSDMRTYTSNSLESFQIILYNNPVPPFGDNEIKIQYKTFNNTSLGDYYSPGAYCTIGIENYLCNDGLQYTFSNDYPTAAMPLDDGTALFITTYPSTELPSPSLSYNPEIFNFSLQPDQFESSTLSILNDGELGSVLYYDVSQEYPTLESPFEVPGGGPDGSGYFWSDSDLEPSIDYEWTDISDISTQLSFSHNDWASDPLEIGFEFPFYEQTYTQCIVNPNGWIGFGDDNSEWENFGIPSSNAPCPAIFGFWDDLDPLQGGEVYYYGDSEKFVVWFDDVIHYPGTNNGTYDFQMILYPNGDIQVNYQYMEGDITTATIGIQNGEGNIGLQVVFNDSYVHDNLSLHFRQVTSLPNWLTITPQEGDLQGELQNGESATFTVEANSSGLPLGSYSANININTNSQPTVIVPVILSVLSNGNQTSISFTHINGWNMIGLPLIVEDNSCDVLFTDFVEGTLYSYDGNYVQEDSLQIGNGYWLRFNNPGISTIIGTPINELIINLSEGWNMFSGISFPIDVDNIGDPDGIIISNTIYGHEEAYLIPTEIEPGRGYWIRASAAGEITLSTTRKTARTVKFIDRTVNANTITFTNKEGKTNSLYFGVDIPEDERLSYSLPPISPEGFDIRFIGNWKAIEESGIIEVRNGSESVTLTYDVSIEDNEDMKWVLFNVATGEEFLLGGSGEIEVAENIERFKLSKRILSVDSDLTEIPTEFTLYPSYPNPFNPSTTIKYAVPDPSKVRISVFDILGREVTELCNENKQPGYYKVVWNASHYASGIYFIQMNARQNNSRQTGDYVNTLKISLIK